jgi:hypothetical protein
MVEGTAWLNNGLLTLCLDRNQKRGYVYTKRERTNPRSAVLRNITAKADQAANNWHRTKDPKYREEWYKILKQIPVDKKYNYPI